MDGRGNGLSDRPTDARAYADKEFVADALSVLDAVGTEQAVVVGFSAGCFWALALAANHPERIIGAVFIGNGLPFAAPHAERAKWSLRFNDEVASEDGWAKSNRNYWLRNYPGYVDFFMHQMFPEPHSTKQIEDTTGWALETTPQVLIATSEAPSFLEEELRAFASGVSCPVLVLHGDNDRISPVQRAGAFATAVSGTCVVLKGSGHAPHARDPVKVNLLLRQFIDSVAKRNRSLSWTRGRSRVKRALYVSSPIGLGHARRDIAIATELRKIVPGLEIEWLAQDPVTRILEANGETIHPASRVLANESRHIEDESSSHRLHVFEAWRRMDEILLSNFMVFLEAVKERDYDLWIGDEAWELDYYLHENPELKRAAYVWLTDFVGWLPMSTLGERDEVLTADYNAEMIEQVERFPWVRDRAIFIGRPQDVVPGRFGPELAEMPAWTKRHYQFTGGYIFGHDQPAAGDREELRRQFGFGESEKVCIASVGGSAVGTALLSRLMQAFPAARRRVPGLRMIAVAGPRIDAGSLPSVQGVEVRGFVPDLNLQLAACDIALTQGGLSTTMELTAARRPFIYFPLRDHCEQNIHVRHRLEQYRAGRCMQFEEATPENLAEAIHSLVSRPVESLDVETGTARRAAELIAELL
jgi:pimeloyl-ACP methyl ester carboxylesterase